VLFEIVILKWDIKPAGSASCRFKLVRPSILPTGELDQLPQFRAIIVAREP
jgi:hypothetical protein